MGAQDNGGVSKSPTTKAGEWVAVNTGDGTAAGINYSNPLIRFMGSIYGALHRTNTAYLADYKDGKEVLRANPSKAPFVCEVIIHDQNPKIVFANHDTLKFSVDTGNTFNNVPYPGLLMSAWVAYLTRKILNVASAS